MTTKGVFRTHGAISAIAIAIMGFGGTSAYAQQPAPADDAAVADKEIVVTGSIIRGTPEDAALPVDVFSVEDLAQSGTSSPLDFIKDLPSVGAVLGDSNQFSANAQGLGGVGSINLRGLGPQRTLVLLNGKRTIVSPGDGLVDTNLMPLFALQRIEILKDGAAVTYGSDAVGGVANFITRKKFEGIEVSGDYRLIEDSDGEYSASIVAGKNFGAANILAGFGYRHRSPLAVVDRDFAVRPYTENPSPFSTLGNPATFFPAIRRTGPIRNNPANTSLRRTGVNPPLSLLGATPTVDAGLPANRAANCATLGGILGSTGGLPICRFTFVPFNNLVEEQDFYQAYSQIDVELSDRVKFHADALWARSDTFTELSPSFPPTQGPSGPGATFNFFVPETNPGFATFVNQTGFTNPLPVGTPGRGAVLFLGRTFAFSGFPGGDFPFGNDSFSKNNSYRISTGLDIELNDRLTAQISGTYIEAGSKSLVPDIVGVRLQNALDGLGGANCNVATGTPGVGDCQFFNPFTNAFAGNPVLGVANPLFGGQPTSDLTANLNSPELIRSLFANTGTSQKEEQFVVDAQISGETGLELGGGNVAFGIGAQYRSSTFRSRPRNDDGLNLNDRAANPCPILGDRSCAVDQGPFIFLGQSSIVNVNQKVYAVFAEIDVPVTDALNVTLAARYEDYGKKVGSTFNPKASVRFEATDWLTLRGTVGTTFRAPLPTQVANDSVTALVNIVAAGSNFRSVDVFGNPNNLGPEDAFTYNLGFIVKTGGLNFTTDFFSYDFSDRITNTPSQAIANSVITGAGTAGSAARLANCASPNVSLITFQGGCVQGVTTGGDISRIRTQTVNGPGIKTNGLDFALDYRFDAGPGVATVGGSATVILKYNVADFLINGLVVQPGYKALGFTNYDRDPGTVSKYRGSAYVNYNVSNLNARYVFRYASSAKDNRCPPRPGVCATTEFGTTDFGRKVRAYTQHDFNLTYDLKLASSDVQIQASVENIFDRDPSAARLELSYDPFFGNPLGRTFRLGLKAAF